MTVEAGEYRGFKVDIEDPGILWITFNRPEKLNGFSSAIKRDMIEVLTQAQMDNAVRVVVFTGEGRAFCAGDDLKAYAKGLQAEPGLVPPINPGHDSGIGTYEGLRVISQALNTAIRRLDKLSIAAIRSL